MFQKTCCSVHILLVCVVSLIAAAGTCDITLAFFLGQLQ